MMFRKSNQSRRSQKRTLLVEGLEKRLPMAADVDDAINEAVFLGAATTTAKTRNDSISLDVDVDIYAFTVNAGQAVDFDIDTSVNGPGGLGSYLRLFNAQGTQLATNNDGAAPGENVVGFDAYLRFTFASSGTYYIGVSNANNTNYDPIGGEGDTAGGQNATGTYQISVQALPVDLDDAINEASLIGTITTTPLTTAAVISPDVDVDMYRINVAAGQIVDFDIDTTLNGPSGLGSYLRLFNAQGQQLAANNDGLAPGENTLGFDAYLRFTFPTNGAFYVAVSNSNNTNYDPVTGNGDTAGGLHSVGDYQLIVQALPVDPDDTLSEATALGVVSTTPITRAASINPDIDVDMYRFDVIAGQIVDFDIDTALNGPGGLGSYLRLFNSLGAQLAFNNDAAAPGEGTVGFDAYLRHTFTLGGTYYIGVSNFTNSSYDPITGTNDVAGGQYSIGDYQLFVQTPSAPPNDTDDTIVEANAFGAVTQSPKTFSGSISPDIDVDMISFVVTGGMVVDFDIDTTLNGGAGLGSYLRLFNAQGTQLAFNNDGAAPGENVVGFDAYLRFTFATPGTYYIGVSNSNNILYDAVTGSGDTAGGANATGDYQLTIQALPVDPDDGLSEATLLGTITTTPIATTATISPDIDVDMYRFTVLAGQVVDFDIDTDLNGVGGLGSYLRLFNSQGQQLAFNDDGTAPGENTLGFDAYLRQTFVTGGTYYIGVSNLNNINYDPTTGNGDRAGGLHSIGDYRLIVQTPAPPPVDTDDSIAEAIAMGAITTTPKSFSGTISTDVDVDMYSFTVTADQVVDFDIDTQLNGAGGLGSFLRLFNSQGQQLAANNDGLAPGESTIGFDAYLRFTFASAGTFYIAVSNANNTLYDPLTGNGDTSGGQNATGDYQLIVQALPVDLDDAINEAVDLGAITTTPIITNGSITPDIDVDMYQVTVTAAQVVDFDIDTQLNGQGGLGSYIRLFNAQGLQLAFNNDAAAPGENTVGFDAYMRFTFTDAGTYYLAVSNANNTSFNPVTGDGDAAGGFSSTGDYQLIIQGLPVDPDDTLVEASLLGEISTTPITINASITPDIDVDIYRFTVIAGQVVDFDIDTVTNGVGGLGSFLKLFDAQGLLLAFNNDAAAPGENTVGFDAYLRYTFAAAGTYYIGVSNVNNTLYDPLTGGGDAAGGLHSIGDYQLIIQTPSTAVPDPDDAISEAISLGAITSTPKTTSGTISPDVDVDMYSFSATAGQVIDFDIDTTLNGAGGLGSYLRLFNAAGQQLASNNDAAAPGENRVGFDAYLRFTFNAAATYYIAVSNANNTIYDALTGTGDSSGGANATGDYQLIVQSLPEDTNDSISEAVSLGAISSPAISTSAVITPDIDVDMYSFTVTSDQQVDFDIDTPLNGTGGLGSYLRLFNAQGVELAANNNAAAPGENVVGFDAYLRFTFVTGGTYYIAVSNSNNTTYDPNSGSGDTAGGPDSIGEYQLIVQTPAAPPSDPDDAISEAISLGSITSTPKSTEGQISPDIDVDMFSFSVTAGQIVDFDIDTQQNGVGGLGSYLRLFNAQGEQLATNDNAAAPGENIVSFDAYLRHTFASAGTFYIAVSNSNNTSYDPQTGDGDTAAGSNATGNYQLTVQGLPVDTDDAIVEAIPLGTITTTAISTSASITPDIDVDMYSFSVDAGQVVDFDIDTTLNGIGGLGSYLRLFRLSGEQLASNNDAAAPGEGTVGFDAYLRFTFAVGGTYFIAVSNANNTTYDPLTGAGDTAGGQHSIGEYQLIIQTASVAPPSDTDDAISEAIFLGTIGTSPRTTGDTISVGIDVDMFGFRVSAGQVIDFDVDTVSNGGSGLNSFLRLFNAQGQQLATNNNAAAPGENIVGLDAYLRFTFVTAGTYYLGVSNANNTAYDPVTGEGDVPGGTNAIGTFQLMLQSLLSDPDDTLAEASSLGLITSSASTTSSTITPDVDVDMFSFAVAAGQVVDFDIDTALNGPGDLGSYLRLFNAQGQQLASNNDATAPGESTLGFDAYLRFTFAAAGTYFIAVSNSNNIAYDPVSGEGDTSGGSNSIGNYQLIVQTAPSDPGDIDPDDTISEAFSLGAISQTPTISNASISLPSDVDMYSFTVTSGHLIDIDIDTVPNGAGGLGSYLRLFNAQGQQLAANDNANAPGESVVGFDAYLRHSFSTGGTYYVAVSNSNNISYSPLTGTGDVSSGPNATGAYRLIIQTAVPTSPTLSLSINASTIAELGGVARGMITRNDSDLSVPLVVSLECSDTLSATVPVSVEIPINQSSVTFDITGVHDTTRGTRSVTIGAVASGYSNVSRSLSISDSDKIFHNSAKPTDTNNDNTISAFDALLIINYLNTVGPGPVPEGGPPPFLDVNADNFISAVDALLVINVLNSQAAPEGEPPDAFVTPSGYLDSVDSFFENFGNQTKRRRSI